MTAPLRPDALPDLRTAIPGPASKAWLARLQQVESPNVTAVGDDFPVVWSEACGGAVRDADGNTYVDAGSAFGVALIGHRHRAVEAAVVAQAGTLLHGMGDVHPPAVKIALLERLRQVAPGDLGHAVLCGGGSEAVEVALKTALLATGRPGIIAFSGSYHGLGHGALDATSRRDFRAPFASQLARNTVWVPYPDPLRRPYGVSVADLLAHTLERVDQALGHPAMGGVPIGAVLVEPIQGRGGSIVPPEGFVAGLRALCDRHGALLVADEIFTGCGRTGRMWACDHEAVVPDLLCTGKALAGGLPLAACLGRPSVMAAWGPSLGEALHTSTFLGHPLAAAAGVAALGVLTQDGVPAQAAALERWWLDALAARLGHHPALRDLRGRGLLLGVELRDHGGLTARDRVWRVITGALQRGVIVLPCGIAGQVIQLTPPAVLTVAQREAVVAAIGDALDATAEVTA